jgi:hypothetical protein
MLKAQKSGEFKWIGRKSSGPLIVIDEGAAGSWTGKDGQDHERAKAVDHYIGFVDFGAARAIVLGDDPFDTTWVPTPSSGGGMFVRRLWSDTPEDALDAARAIAADAWTFEEKLFEVSSGAVLLFDSARPGSAPRSVVRIALPPGRYAIATADAEPNEDTCVMAHRLLPLA